jgi:crotonobetainyl-CoA:carnitine CoA-transferase CaiB-like acyl-CoA transferase
MNTKESQSHPKDVATILTALFADRDRRQARQQARAERKQLRTELAAYTSQADLDDLYATLDRYDDSETAAVRNILSQHQTRAA